MCGPMSPRAALHSTVPHTAIIIFILLLISHTLLCPGGGHDKAGWHVQQLVPLAHGGAHEEAAPAAVQVAHLQLWGVGHAGRRLGSSSSVGRVFAGWRGGRVSVCACAYGSHAPCIHPPGRALPLASLVHWKAERMGAGTHTCGSSVPRLMPRVHTPVAPPCHDSAARLRDAPLRCQPPQHVLHLMRHHQRPLPPSCCTVMRP